MKRAIWILSPSFIVGGVAAAVFFTLLDPMELHIFDPLGGLSRTSVYALGFFVLWLFAAASSAFTCFLQRNAFEINHMCPVEPEERPMDCPKNADHDLLLP